MNNISISLAAPFSVDHDNSVTFNVEFETDVVMTISHDFTTLNTDVIVTSNLPENTDDDRAIFQRALEQTDCANSLQFTARALQEAFELLSAITEPQFAD